jgi:ribosomal protein L13
MAAIAMRVAGFRPLYAKDVTAGDWVWFIDASTVLICGQLDQINPY